MKILNIIAAVVYVISHSVVHGAGTEDQVSDDTVSAAGNE